MEKNQVAIVTGAASGLGEAIAEKFASLGYKVVLVDRDNSNMKRVQEKCTSQGHNLMMPICGDLTDDNFCKKVFDVTLEGFGRVDVLVNNAGIAKFNNPLGETSMKDYDATMNTNARAVFLMTQLAVPHLKKTKGCVVNIASVSAHRVFPNMSPYCMSKAAVAHFTRCAANELAPHGIRVNCVAPGAVFTPLYTNAGFTEAQFEGFAQYSKPLKTDLSAADIANSVAFLALPNTKSITGEILHVDCGVLVKSPAD